MKTFSRHRSLLKSCIMLACIVLFPMLSLAEQLTPEFDVEVEPNRYIVHFKLPAYWFETDDSFDYEQNVNFGAEDGCGTFLNIEMDTDFDVTDVVNYPQLPFFSLNLILPNDARHLSGSINEQSIENEYVERYITPALIGSSVDIVNGQYQYTQNDPDPCMFQSFYYSNGYDSIYPNGFYRNFHTISGITNYLSSMGVTLSVFPFSYRPECGEIEVLTSATFIIDYDGDDVNRTISDYTSSTAYSTLAIASYYDNFNNMRFYADQYDAPRFLIVASHQDMAPTLQHYIAYKQRQNYNVEVAYLDNYGIRRPSEIKDLIDSTYSNPDYVLLVGNLQDIPASTGNAMPNNPFTDDTYHPFLGRWIVNGENYNYPELDTLISKTIATETAIASRSFTSTAVLYSGTDPTCRRMNKHFYSNIKKIKERSFDKMYIPATLYDGRRPNITFNTIAQTLGGHPSFFIYRGLGTLVTDVNNRVMGSAITEPYNISPTSAHNSDPLMTLNPISSLNNASPFPMGFGFADMLNSYGTSSSFAAKWLTEGHGGATFYGPTTDACNSSNRYLAKRVFRSLYKIHEQQDNYPISLWLRTAEEKYYKALMGPSRAHQVAKYNLMGDPTFYVFGMDEDGHAATMHAPAVEFEHSVDETEVVSIEMYDIYGQLIGIYSPDELPQNENGSLKIVIVKYSDGEIKTHKIL